MTIRVAQLQPHGGNQNGVLNESMADLGIEFSSLDVYRPESCSFGELKDEAGAYSWCKQMAAKSYDFIVIEKGSKIFPTEWGAALLENCFRALVPPKGKLIIYYANSVGERDSGVVTTEWLERRFGMPEKITAQYVIYCASDEKRATSGSVLSWFYKLLPKIYVNFAEFRSMELIDIGRILTHLANNRSSNINVHLNEINRMSADFLSEEYNSLSKFLNYSFFGVGAKSYALDMIISDLKLRKSLTWGDIGSGAGLLGLEMLATSDNIRNIINYEKSPAQASIGILVSKVLGPEIEHRYGVEICRVDGSGFQFDRKFDIITMLTTLCYIPRHLQMDLLLKAWAALHPQGCLIILENMKTDVTARDSDLMFDNESLDGLLLNLSSKIQYRSAVSGAVLKDSFDPKKSVYRIIQKN